MPKPFINLPRYALFALWLGFLTSLLEAKFRCHNRCNGHGTCNEFNFCVCQKGYQGVDCSDRKLLIKSRISVAKLRFKRETHSFIFVIGSCPYGAAWFDKAHAVDSAHKEMECSNRGICNHRTGECKCNSGYGGLACKESKHIQHAIFIFLKR